MTKTPTQSIASYFKPYAVPYYTTHATNIVKWLEDEGWDIVRRDAAEGVGKPVAWRYAHKGQRDWHVQSQDPREYLSQWPAIGYDVEPLYTSFPIKGNQETFYTILSKYFPKDATFDNLWQELKEAGLVR